MKKGMLGIVSFFAGAVLGMAIVKNITKKTIEEKDEKIYKFKGYYSLLNQWFVLKREGRKLEQYFIDNGYKTIAVYGIGEVGLRLCEELSDSQEIELKYAIDKNPMQGSGLKIFDGEEMLPDVDVIVVTATFAFEEIEEQLREVTSSEIISLDDVIYGL